MVKTETRVLFQARVMGMALAQATKSCETTYTINDAMDVLLSKLDEAIDDMENGDVYKRQAMHDRSYIISVCFM